MNAILYLGFNNPLKYKRGVENVIAVQASALPDVRKLYFCFDDEKAVYRWHDIICISIKKNVFWPLAFLYTYYKVFRKYGGITVHSHNYLMGALIPHGIDFCSVHDGLCYQSRLIGKRVIFPYYLIEVFNYLKSRKIHFVSEFSRSQAKIGRFLTKSCVIYNSAALESHESQSVKSLPVVTPNRRYKEVLIVRSIEERALIGLVINVAASVNPSDFIFVVAGKGPLLEKYKHKVVEMGLKNLVFKGFVSDIELIKLYRHADIVMVTAAYGEGFGLPVIEGYLFNKPVIASHVCAIPEIIVNRDYLFENSVDSVLNLLNKHELYNGNLVFRDYYYKRFGFEFIVSQYKQLYDSLK